MERAGPDCKRCLFTFSRHCQNVRNHGPQSCLWAARPNNSCGAATESSPRRPSAVGEGGCLKVPSRVAAKDGPFVRGARPSRVALLCVSHGRSADPPIDDSGGVEVEDPWVLSSSLPLFTSQNSPSIQRLPSVICHPPSAVCPRLPGSRRVSRFTFPIRGPVVRGQWSVVRSPVRPCVPCVPYVLGHASTCPLEHGIRFLKSVI
jgi:hypothetical protein